MKNRTKQAWLKSIYALIFVALPILLIWVFTSPDFERNLANWNLSIFFGISIAYIIYVILITYLFIWAKVLDLFVFTIVLPLSIAFSIIYVSYSLNIWLRLFLVILAVLCAIPINIIIIRIKDKHLIKRKIELKRNKKTR